MEEFYPTINPPAVTSEFQIFIINLRKVETLTEELVNASFFKDLPKASFLLLYTPGDAKPDSVIMRFGDPNKRHRHLRKTRAYDKLWGKLCRSIFDMAELHGIKIKCISVDSGINGPLLKYQWNLVEVC